MVEILMEGEATYLKALEQQTMLDAQTLTYLSDRVVSKHLLFRIITIAVP